MYEDVNWVWILRQTLWSDTNINKTSYLVTNLWLEGERKIRQVIPTLENNKFQGAWYNQYL